MHLLTFKKERVTMEHPSKTVDKGLKSLSPPSRNISELSSRNIGEILKQDSAKTRRALNPNIKREDPGLQPQKSGWSR